VANSVVGSVTDDEVSVAISPSNITEDLRLSLKMLAGLRMIEDSLLLFRFVFLSPVGVGDLDVRGGVGSKLLFGLEGDVWVEVEEETVLALFEFDPVSVVLTTPCTTTSVP
jgi:hypothetical protein